ncbi:MAG: sll0787 family AIR synthase-like protein [Myxococcota bacterium]|nr:sll0787 family AIR synthase-like protein [Myxococcota bacterium]
MTTRTLEQVTALLRESSAFQSKRDIASITEAMESSPRAVERWKPVDRRVRLGDDTAAIPDGAGYLLFAAEGMSPEFLDGDPYFAGWSSVMVNVSDVAAMGGYPLAVVDVYFHTPASAADAVIAGMRDACAAYGVPLVGGHTSRSTGGPHALVVAVLGRAERLLTSFGAHSGDAILFAVDLRGEYRPGFPFWNATAGRAPESLRGDLELMGTLAASGGVHACKDVSNAGIAGTLLMLLEASGVGGVLRLDGVPMPNGVPLEKWLLTFPSYGFLITTPTDGAAAVRGVLRERGLACECVGRVDGSHRLRLSLKDEQALLWDLTRQSFTGFGPPRGHGRV